MSCYFCGETQRVNAASIFSNDSTSRTKYDFRKQGFDHMQPYFSADRLYEKRHGKDVSMSIDWLEPAYVLKELVDIPAGVHRKEKVSFQPDETLDTGQETSTGSSSRQGTTTPSGHRVRFNPKYS
ncbi:hypothetical protein NPIL_376991 [Nephila pilipes]|uniref:Uncharacterized protein n=1 Tax=Nephila pilipes TaxID=299642 RepID=A0A8X6NB16_NEPPI|nr:hypothetical protein NPIL_376991 [Nephila pilipes]